MQLNEGILQRVGPLDEIAMAAARSRQAQLTKPQGSLGRLEMISIQVAGITGQLNPPLEQRAIIIAAGDHGVAAQGVSAYPSEVTPQMVINFLSGGAGINVLARQAGARVLVLDAGVAAPLPDHPDLIKAKIAPGTGDISQGPAMTWDQAVQSIKIGFAAVEAEIARGLDMVGTGDMGIGNTTPSSAICSAITGAEPVRVTGRGTGIGDATWEHKVAVVEQALRVNCPDPTDPLDVLTKVGGFEIGAIAGIILGAAAHRIPVLMDGFISTAGALIAAGLSPQSRAYMIAAHRSVEPGHRITLDHLGLQPIFDLDLRLGEGTGAALAMPVVAAAVALLNQMATFEEAGVAGKKMFAEA
ncbi:MAG TPA: nicotinate-nucleotide--dimethylbenzimidazole phosphoribosyltransferase [Anaerolineae bacterium]|nr:nicotinate-nucleotide--dimethylbenzimidazole phosphoribosyltransferase [Anaerolineae bacterium]HIQ05108.1 nicotinate-nucleotide--dimethylbenzimidazole phosphoribosyltransferase [Anaerolineae bacterium]